jgi:SAM-dependent methyltransferase
MAARARAKGLDVRIGDLGALPFEDGRFDLSYGFKVLAHVPDPEAAIAEAARVTRRGGHVVFDVYNRWSLRFLAKTAVGPRTVGAGRTEADLFTRWDSPRSVARMLPPSLRLLDYRGVRVLTPFAAMHRWPLVGPALRRAERIASRSPLRAMGGFLVILLRKD